MEVEALEAILMDDFQELESAQAGGFSGAEGGRCFQVTISPMGDNEDEPTEIPVRLALIFAHTPQYPDELPLLNVRSLQGVKPGDVEVLKAKLLEEAQESLGMAMVYTLATSAKEWLREHYGQEAEDDEDEEEQKKEEVIVPHGLPVTLETFLEWRETYEAELALEAVKLAPAAALAANKEKRMTGRQWFETGRHLQRGAAKTGVVQGEDGEDEEEEEFAEYLEDDDIDEEDMLEHYLATKG